jgi:outer membrane immunogenic protein
MKTYFISLLLLLLLFQSEKTVAQIFKPGIIAGFVATDVDGVDQRDNDNDFNKAGLTLGGLLNTKLSEKNSLQFEILYTQKGSLQKPDSLGNEYYKLNLNYVEIPLLFKHKIAFNVRKKKITNFYLEAGPSFGRLVQVKQEGTYNYGSAYENNFKDNEFAINFGVGCRIVNNLFLNVRYCNSLSSVVKQNTSVGLNGFFWYEVNKGANLEFAFTLRYIFSKDKEKNIAKEPDSN